MKNLNIQERNVSPDSQITTFRDIKQAPLSVRASFFKEGF